MSTKLSVAAALAGTLLATSFISASAQATSVPVLKGDASPSIVTLVGRGGGGGGHGGGGWGGGHGGGHGGGKRYYDGGGKHYYDGGGKHYYGGGKHYAYKGHHHRYYPYGYYGWYGLPYVAYGYGDTCAWLYRRAVATGSRYWCTSAWTTTTSTEPERTSSLTRKPRS
jgi:hypothetical protein